MKVSHLGLIPKRMDQITGPYEAQEMLLQTGQIYQYVSGIYAYGHIPYLLKENIIKVIDEVFYKYGLAKVSLPILQPESIWEESGRLSKYIDADIMFRSLTEKGNFSLAPTAEEAALKYASPLLRSHKTMPVTFYQIGEKFRNEIRTRGYLLRGRSFDMMDAYSFGRNQEDLDQEYNNIKNAYKEIFKKLHLETYIVDADNGDMGGKKSEEFMLIAKEGEDEIYINLQTKEAYNLEHKDTKDLVKEKVVELGHIFQLGDTYSKSMNGTYADVNDKQKHYLMGCYGIGVSRTLAMIYEKNAIFENDTFTGVSLPASIAPYKLYIIPKLDDQNKKDQALEVYEELTKNNIKVLYDDRDDYNIGAKLKDSKVVGTPYVVVFGKTLEEGYLELENTKTKEKEKLTKEELINKFKSLN